MGGTRRREARYSWTVRIYAIALCMQANGRAAFTQQEGAFKTNDRHARVCVLIDQVTVCDSVHCGCTRGTYGSLQPAEVERKAGEGEEEVVGGAVCWNR